MADDFSLPKMDVKLILEFTNRAGKEGKLVCTITNKQIEGYEKFCISSRVIRDHWITIKHMFQDCPIIEKKLIIPFNYPISGKQILEYISYCRTGKYDEEKFNHPSCAAFADFMGDELFLDDFGKHCHSQFWSDEEMVMNHSIFWAYVYLPYINETFYLNIPQERKEIIRYLRKIEYEKIEYEKIEYEKIDRSDPSWILTVDFEGLLDTEEYMGDRWITRATMVRNVSRKKKFSHRKCLYRFLTFSPLIAKKVLEDDPSVLICDTNLAVKLRKRVMTKEYDEIVEITKKELEEKTPGITCWREEDERRFREFSGGKLTQNEYNDLLRASDLLERRHRKLVDIFQGRSLFCDDPTIYRNYRDPFAGRLSLIEQASEAKINKKVENYKMQQSTAQKKKNKQRKKEEANQCFQGNGKPNPKGPIIL